MIFQGKSPFILLSKVLGQKDLKICDFLNLCIPVSGEGNDYEAGNIGQAIAVTDLGGSDGGTRGTKTIKG